MAQLSGNGTFFAIERYRRSPSASSNPMTRSSLLQADRNVWRVEPAHRLSVFPDVASCYAAMRSSMRKAQRAITIVGWDIDSRCRLVGAQNKPDDGLPAELAPFLKALCESTPGLRVNLLLWDFSSLYAMEREAFPRVKLAWEQAELRLDDVLPVGCSQHQKIVLIDDSVAFSGGLDLTIRRWDTREHRPNEPRRVDPSGTPYEPFHDVQAIVDGSAAAALAELVRARWQMAAGETLQSHHHKEHDCWPDNLKPDLTAVEVGISRTMPAIGDQKEVREVERLFLDMIGTAEASLYIENQYVTSGPVAEALARQLKLKPELTVLIVAPRSHDPWLESMTMRNGRIRFRRILEQAGVGERVRFVYPHVRGRMRQKPVFVHSKVMIVDDKVLRIGSANLNNRSMGADSECDLVVEASSQEQAAAIASIRNRLISVHCGMPPERVETELKKNPSLVAASRTLGTRKHSFGDVDDGEPDALAYKSYLERLADPERPVDQAEFLSMISGDSNPATQLRLGGWFAMLALILLGISGAWSYWSGSADELLTSVFAKTSSTNYAFLAVVTMFVAGGLFLIPITLLIVATSATVGVGWGLVYAAVGTLISAALSYGVGAWMVRTQSVAC